MERQQIFMDFVACFMERRLDDLSDHLHDQLTVNGRPLSPAEYRADLAGSLGIVPDLKWTVQEVASDGTLVAAELLATGTPRAEFLGVPATGRRMAMSELMMCRFRDDKIDALWVQVDVPAMRASLGGPTYREELRNAA